MLPGDAVQCVEGHDLRPLGGEFCWCRDCDMLFHRQPGATVWVWDRHALALARLLDSHISGTAPTLGLEIKTPPVKAKKPAKASVPKEAVAAALDIPWE